MRYRKLTGDGDYSFGNGQLDFWVNVPEAVGQAVQTGLLLWQGEWFLNTDLGTPYATNILGKRTKDQADTAIRQQIALTQGYVSIDTYESVLDPNNRALTVTTTVNTIYGPTVVQVENLTNF